MAAATVSANFTVAVSAPSAKDVQVSAAVQYRGPQSASPFVVISTLDASGNWTPVTVDLATARRIQDEIGAAVTVAQKLTGRAQRILDRADD